MNLTGAHTINASAKKIWDMLMDPDTLARITPAISKLEKIDNENFKAIADVKIGPVSGVFTGNLKLSDIKEPESFTLSIQQNSKVGNANAVMKMNLKALSDSQTEMSFDGDVKLSGMLNMMGQRVLTPVANMLSAQFFEALEKEVAV
jgi:carbon monoxide dehydrogenase subunit G